MPVAGSGRSVLLLAAVGVLNIYDIMAALNATRK